MACVPARAVAYRSKLCCEAHAKEALSGMSDTFVQERSVIADCAVAEENKLVVQQVD